MKRVYTYTANIYVGLRHGYSDTLSSVDDVRHWLQNYCNKVKLGVTLTPTEFIYVNGGEPGVIIGLIQYPRFSEPTECIKNKALEIARGLLDLCQQERISIVFPKETIMLERDDY